MTISLVLLAGILLAAGAGVPGRGCRARRAEAGRRPGARRCSDGRCPPRSATLGPVSAAVGAARRAALPDLARPAVRTATPRAAAAGQADRGVLRRQGRDDDHRGGAARPGRLRLVAGHRLDGAPGPRCSALAGAGDRVLRPGSAASPRRRGPRGPGRSRPCSSTSTWSPWSGWPTPRRPRPCTAPHSSATVRCSCRSASPWNAHGWSSSRRTTSCAGSPTSCSCRSWLIVADVMQLDETGAALSGTLRARVRELRDAHLTSEQIKASAAAEGMTIYMTLPALDLQPDLPRRRHAQDLLPGRCLMAAASNGSRLLRGLGALLLLLGVIIGVPVASGRSRRQPAADRDHLGRPPGCAAHPGRRHHPARPGHDHRLAGVGWCSPLSVVSELITVVSRHRIRIRLPGLGRARNGGRRPAGCRGQP